MNKKLMIAMVVVGMSALYVRFQVVGMEEGDQVEQKRQRLERETERVVQVPGVETSEISTGPSAEIVKNNYAQMWKYEIGKMMPLSPKVVSFLYHKLCIPVQTLFQNDEIYSVAFSPNGRLLATGSGGPGIWDVASGQRLQTLQRGGTGIRAVAFSPDGRLLATGSSDGTAVIWDVASGQKLKTLQCGAWVLSVSFSPDGRLLATGSGDKTDIWDVANGQRLQTLQGREFVHSVAFSSDGKLLATGSADGTAVIWDVANGKRLQMLQHANYVTSVSFSPDGKLLATGSFDVADIWDVVTGQKLKTLQHIGWVNSVAFSPDGKLLATGSGDKTAVIWNVESRQRVYVFQHDSLVRSVAFSPNGKLLATAKNRDVFLWNMECWQTLERSTITTAEQYKLMEAFNLVLQDTPNGTVRIVGKINATPEQWAILETLPENMQTALRPLIRNEKDQKKVADYHSKREAAAALAEQAASLGKEEEESAASAPSGEETSAKEAADRYLDVGHSGIG